MNRITCPTLCVLSLALTACGSDIASSSHASASLPTRLAASFVAVTGPAGQTAADYLPTFTEEFGPTLNTNLWNDHIWYETANASKNFALDNGNLRIWPQRDASGSFFNRTFTTDGHFSQAYGFFEIEAKLPKGKGTMPSFWLLNRDGSKRPEIDIMKAMPGAAGWGKAGSDTVLYPTALGLASWLDATAPVGSTKLATVDLSADFHKYGMRWEKDKQTFYFDGKEVYSVKATLSTPMFILVDLWFGGAAGTPDHTTPTGQANSLEVRYVKAWQFKSGTGMAPVPPPVVVPPVIPPVTPPVIPPVTPPVTPPPVPPVTPPSGTTSAVPYGQSATAYTLSFSEEFNNGFNTARWNDKIWYETAPATKNYTVENGALKIWPQRDAAGKFFNRTIDTDGKYYQTYGYFEIEAKLPKGKGTWPAFWLFNHIGARRPEIDIMEAYAGGAAPWGQNVNGVAVPTMYASTIWIDAGKQAGMIKVPTPDLSAAFHKYALKWEPGRLTFYFDGKQVYTNAVSFTDPMYIMLDLWYGSASGQPDASTPTGKANSYEVNYVRAWKLK